jgi:hypothetical protein
MPADRRQDPALRRLAGQSRETSPVECGSAVLCEPGVAPAAATAGSCITRVSTVHRRQRHGEPHPQLPVAARLCIDRHPCRCASLPHALERFLARRSPPSRPTGASEPPAAACKRGQWQTLNTLCKGRAAMHEVQYRHAFIYKVPS